MWTLVHICRITRLVPAFFVSLGVSFPLSAPAPVFLPIVRLSLLLLILRCLFCSSSPSHPSALLLHPFMASSRTNAAPSPPANESRYRQGGIRRSGAITVPQTHGVILKH